MIQNSTNFFPPWDYLFQVLDHCPKAGRMYMLLWNTCKEDYSLRIDKISARMDFLSSTAKLRHDLLLLVKEGLISINETPYFIDVELVTWDETLNEEEAE